MCLHWRRHTSADGFFRKWLGSRIGAFTLHLGNFGSGDVTVVEAYRTMTMALPSFLLHKLSFQGEAHPQG
jgi:hypothetical protein